ncbi:radical SAM protein [Candidatus Dependentiae bacterium]|nr:radical SAM protein [Candidatus Dependentiae bacterium]
MFIDPEIKQLLKNFLYKNFLFYFEGKYKYDGTRFLHLFLSLVNYCSMKCKMCHHYILPEPEHQILTLDNFIKLADNVFPYVKEIAFSPTVESLEHPDFSKILELTNKKYNIPDIFIMSNLNLLNEEHAECIVENNVKHIQVSFDSYKPEIYKWIKTNGNVDKVIDNIKKINFYKMKYGKLRPEIHFNFVIMKKTVENYDENYMKLAAELKIKVIHLWHIQINKKASEVLNESMWNYKKEYNEFYDKVVSDAKKYSIDIFRIPDKFDEEDKYENHNLLNENRLPLRKCSFPWHKIQAYPNGEFTPCEFWYNEMPWGNLIKNDFFKIWNSAGYRKLRWEIITNNLSRYCCKNCVSMSDLKGRTNCKSAFRNIDTEKTDPK